MARRDSGREPPNDEWWTATGPLGEFVAEDPVVLLGLVAMRAARGPDWKPTDAEVDDFMARFHGGRPFAAETPMPRPLVLFVDVDDTLVRSFGSKRIPMTPVVERVRALHAEGAMLYAWSSGGADYARSSAEELGLVDCFVACLPKPHVFVDDVRIEAWRTTVQLHPNEVAHRTLDDLRALVAAPDRP